MRFVRASNNNLTIDNLCYSFDGVEYKGPYFIHQANEQLIRSEYRGHLFVKYTFDVRDVPNEVHIMFEKLNYLNIIVNGISIKPSSVQQSSWDILFSELDIHDFIKTGKNEIIFEIDYFQKPIVKYALYDPSVTESIKNCLTIDTELESIYVQGDFYVDNQNVIVLKPINNINVTDLQKNGFRFFNGSVFFETSIRYNGGKCQLRFSGRYMTVKVRNGNKVINAVLNECIDITELLEIGQNKLLIEIVSSPRNMLGPHHFAGLKEGDWVTPFNFTMYGYWLQEKNPFYDSNYNIVPFGLDSIELITSR